MRDLDRPHAGQRLEPVQVGVEQDAAVADDRDRREVGQRGAASAQACGLSSRSPA